MLYLLQLLACSVNSKPTQLCLAYICGAILPAAANYPTMQVNSYPSMRIFTAVGLDSMDVPSSSTSSADEASSSPSSSADFLQLTLAFHQSIRVAVEGVVGPVPDDAVSTRPSSQGKYVSVKVGEFIAHSGMIAVMHVMHGMLS